MGEMKIGKVIQWYRMKEFEHIEDFADVLGRSVTHVQHVENGSVQPSWGFLYKVAKVLNIDIKDLTTNPINFNLKPKEVETTQGSYYGMIKMRQLNRITIPQNMVTEWGLLEGERFDIFYHENQIIIKRVVTDE